MSAHPEVMNMLNWALVVCVVGLLAVHLCIKLFGRDENDHAPEEKIQEAISRFPKIKNTISDQLNAGKILTTKDLNEIIADCLLFERNEAIRQRQLSKLNTPPKN